MGSIAEQITESGIDLVQEAANQPTTPPKEVDIRVGQNLRNARNLRGMTQRRLGEAVGLTLQQIQKYENGTNRITVSRLHQLAEILNIPVAQFFAGPPAQSPTQESKAAADDLSPEDGSDLKFSADDFEILNLAKKLPPRLKRRVICLIEEVSDYGSSVEA